MAHPAYLLDRPAVVSFSGGRTSGFMLWNVLQAFGGTLPDNVKVIFCNTGKERPETLDFVERCSQRWGVEIVWLEYRRWPTLTEAERGRWHCKPKAGKPITGFDVVDYVTASRDGRPFGEVIDGKGILPNAVKRYCTQWLKIKTNWRYVRNVLRWGRYGNAIGLRADEPRRVRKLKPDPESTPGEEPFAPTATAGHTLTDVMAFWARQPFDLELKQGEGNCDLCFLKKLDTVHRILRQRPDLASWWIRQEQRFVGKTRREAAGRFRKDRPGYAQLLKQVQEQPEFTWGDDDLAECRCTD